MERSELRDVRCARREEALHHPAQCAGSTRRRGFRWLFGGRRTEPGLDVAAQLTLGQRAPVLRKEQTESRASRDGCEGRRRSNRHFALRVALLHMTDPPVTQTDDAHESRWVRRIGKASSPSPTLTDGQTGPRPAATPPTGGRSAGNRRVSLDARTLIACTPQCASCGADATHRPVANAPGSGRQIVTRTPSRDSRGPAVPTLPFAPSAAAWLRRPSL